MKEVKNGLGKQREQNEKAGGGGRRHAQFHLSTSTKSSCRLYIVDIFIANATKYRKLYEKEHQIQAEKSKL